ncbi:hypothetical protein BC829DRAFT_487635 [Chytridium lagenaria]|nr:hypothetical protein BC829DRAFT_487635 [Chytridium lagenaria]
MNTILNKYQNIQCIENCSDPDPLNRRHPHVIGEAMCLLVFHSSRLTSARTVESVAPVEAGPSDNVTAVPPAAIVAVFLLWIPTLCDMTATTLMSVGLLYISASIYQMLRGSVVLFTGGLSTIFLGRRHPAYRCPLPVLPIGVILVVMAQTITASQFVIEELIMAKYDIPLYVLSALKACLVGFMETVSTPSVFYAGIGICFSISFFNWSGLSVTNRVSATARSTIDTCRTVFIWAISLYLRWETFKYIQVAGFVVLVYGTFVFNDVIAPPFCFAKPTTAYRRIDDEENE